MSSLFKKRTTAKFSPNAAQPKVVSSSKELSELIDRLQKNADQVERYIVDTDAKLQKDVEKIKASQPVMHKEATNSNISESERIVVVLETDALLSRHLNHPQAEMIQEDIRQLKERLATQRQKHDQIYNQKVAALDAPKVNWSKVIDDKMDQLNNTGFATDLPNVENQIMEHNVVHNEIRAVGDHINKDGDKEYISGLQVKYHKLLSASQKRQRDLGSLQDYMQRCTNELYWLDQQEKERMEYDWSDRNTDYISRRRQYENFIQRSLESKEDEINKLQEEGEKVLADGHPAKVPIEAHMDAVHADWKEYLNLLICEESHLKYMEDYHQFYRDAKDSQDLLKKVDTDLDLKYSPDFKDKYQVEAQLRELEDQDKALDKYEDVVQSIQKHSHQVVPLKFRRETPLKPVPVVALCDFYADEGEIRRGSQYTLKNNRGEKWEVTDGNGKKLVAPGVCFNIPPTDPEAVALGDSLMNQYRSTKQKAAGSRKALLQRLEDVKRESSATTNAQETQGRQMLAGLDRVISDLDRQEKAISSQLRPPLDQNRAVQDSSERLNELKNVANNVRRIEPEKTQKVQECEVYLSKSPEVSSTPILRSKISETNKKYDKVNELLNCSQDKIEAANRLEGSLQKSKDLLATYENKLCQDDTVPEDPRAVDNKLVELSAMSSELQKGRGVLAEAEKDLQKSKLCCQNAANRFQEHCPDIERQEAEVSKLNQRYSQLDQQIQSRSQALQKAKTAYTNYRNGYDQLDGWLRDVPNYEPKDSDSVKQVETKLNNQRRLVGEIADREQDLDHVTSSSQQYQHAVKDYELDAEKLRSVLDVENRRSSYPKRSRVLSPANKVKEEEADLSARFTEASAINKQRVQTLEFAQNLLRQQPEVEMRQESVQMVRSERPPAETWKIQNMLDDEMQRRQQLESEIRSSQEEIIYLQNQKPQETIVKKEVLKKVPDPQLEEEYHKVLEKFSEEGRKNKSLQDELEALRLKVRTLEYEQKEGGQEYIVKEVLRIEKDREQQEDFRRLKEDLEEMNRQKSTKQNEISNLKERILILSQEKNKPQEKITEKEVVKLQNDPQLASEYRILQENMQRENAQRQKEEEELQLLQEKLKRLEKERAMAEGKITVKEVLKVEKDLASEREVSDLRRQYEDETSRIRITQREKTELIRKISIMEEDNAKVVIQEKVREIIRPDPKAESELANLRVELIEQERKYRASEEQLKIFQSELQTLKARGPEVEVKEITKEVIKHKTDPEVLSELERLRGEILDKTRVVERSELENNQLKQEIKSWMDTKPQVQVKEVVQEVLQYREDPDTKKEVETLRAKLAEEQRKRIDLENERMTQEEKIRQKENELSQVREKVVQQEVVKYEEDPMLKSELNSFSKSIQTELKQKDSLQEELHKLQWRKSELERQLEELERERQSRREAELEIQRLKYRLNELEQREIETKEKVTLKQKVILQQDPQQEKEHNMLKLQVEEERHRRQILQTELDALRKKLITLEKMEVKEKVVFTEKIEVEKDAETEQEIQRLKCMMEEESKRKRDLEVEVERLNAHLSETEFNNSKSNKELEYLREEVHKLQMEKQSLQLETRHLHSEIEITIKEAQGLRSLTQVDSGVNLDSRLASLEQELRGLQKISQDKDAEIEQLNKRLETMQVKREQRENHLRRSIVVIDPDTGREMSPEEARNLGLIDWKMFVNLQSQECDWEETTIKGPNGDSSVIHDRKSGKKFNIEDALRNGRITKRQYENYLNKEMSIQEFAALVSGK
ncbi:PREDICTED: periplakin [Nanorana parkeri]|uniref:periplakin n=1 Tax=Nanorana parkeri TaxID=125878 RepID=UPI0008550923|nr:PREDICTED: periplakin [Nanorana parkeri]